MKFVHFAFVVCGFVSLSTAHARPDDSLIIIRDGKEYRCEATGSGDGSSGGNPIDCVNKAYSGPFSKEESMRLCAGAKTTVPAECGLKAYSGPFSKEESIRLCERARSMGPVDCATKAYSGPFSKEESLSLCSRDGDISRVECAIKAYSGPYNKEESIRLCKGDSRLMIRAFKLMESSPEVQGKVFDIRLKLGLPPVTPYRDI